MVRQVTAECGTIAGYNRHARLAERRCAPCLAAWSAYYRERRRRTKPPTLGSLFSGIGGMDLGLERAGMEVLWQSENDPYAAAILARHWPSVPNLGDIRTVDWSTVETPDVIAGGFPCQPVSSAGRQRGQSDERWLWPEFASCLRHLRPRHIIVENVPNLLTIDSGRAAQEVFGTLATLGYDTEWDCIPAAYVDAPHRRYRLFVIATLAYAERSGSQRRRTQRRLGESRSPLKTERGSQTLAHSDESGWRWGTRIFGAGGRPQPQDSSRWEPEPNVGRMVDGVPHRVDRIRCLGNAVVPQVAEYIGRLLMSSAGGSP